MEMGLATVAAEADKISGAPDAVTVATTARLHFGFLDPSGRGREPFGSLGLSIDRPQTRLRLRRAETVVVRGPEQARAEVYLQTLAVEHGLVPRYELDIETAIPPHSGLGSGTQLALAVGTAFSRLEGLNLDPTVIARQLDRGRRSGIGIGTFAQGGLVLDSGPRGTELPRIVDRAAFPDDWRILLLFDESTTGLHGAAEIEAFRLLPAFPEAETAELRERVLKSVFPAVATGDFTTFSCEIGALQHCMGAYFEPLQGGIYTSPRVAAALQWLGSKGITGLGQTSWGPTGFAFVISETAAKALLVAAAENEVFAGLRVEIARPRNQGASITLV